MEWVARLRGATVGLDTAPLIYLIERHPVYYRKLRPFFEAAERHEFQLVTSVVTLIEVLILPLRTGRRDLAREYRDILVRSASLKAIPVTLEISEEAALAFAHFSRVSWNQTRCLWCSNGIRAKLDPTSKSTA